MEFEFTTAVRESVPMLISLAGVSGSGKTFSALLIAAGLAGPGGKVCFIDAENKRGRMYADSPGIVKAYPNGYLITDLNPPYTPERYTMAIQAAEQAGASVTVVDSTSHEWEGLGGCCDIAENNKLRGMPNWSKAKLAHKKFLNQCLLSKMHIIFCLRAREKVKIVEVGKETKIVPVGIQPIAEKSFVFEMLLSMRVEEESHLAVPIKCPEPLVGLFPEPRLLTKADGDRIREWNESGRPEVDPYDRLKRRSRGAAECGTEEYQVFFESCTKAERHALAESGWHAENKSVAKMIDKQAAMSDAAEPAEEPVDA